MTESNRPHTLLFVYGSLRRDEAGRHHPLLAGAEFMGRASVRGRLYRVSWHPGFIVDEAGGPVVGELFRIPADRHDAIFAGLLEYEGPDFELTAVPATRDGGEEVAACLFAWLGDPSLATLVPTGDFGIPNPHPAG